MTTEPNTPESPEPVEVPLHMIPPDTTLCGQGPLTRNALGVWLTDHAPGYIEILAAIGTSEVGDERLPNAGRWLAMDLQELTRASYRLARGEALRLVEADEWSSDEGRPDHLRDLAALAASAGYLFAEAGDFGLTSHAYQDLARALSKQLDAELDPSTFFPDVGDRVAMRAIKRMFRAAGPEAREVLARTTPEELAEILQRAETESHDDAA